MENNCDQTSHTYLGLTGQFEDGHIRLGLKEFSTYYANRSSYGEVEELVERTTGEKQLSGQSIQNTAANKALEISKQVYTEAKKVLDDETLGLPEINKEVDVYEVDTKEVLILVDEIGVKKQLKSSTCLRKASLESESNQESKTESASSRVNSNVVLTPKKSWGF